MENENVKDLVFSEEILELFHSGLSNEELCEKLGDYHDNDIAIALTSLSKEERIEIYSILGAEWVSEIFTYLEDPEEYAKELDIKKLAKVIDEMDSDDAVDLLEEMDEETKEQLHPHLDEETIADIELIHSYEDDEIGSMITNNFIVIKKGIDVRQAMRELVKQAGDNDNISTIYVEDEENKFYGAIDLKDLIIAREYVELDSLISLSYPYLMDHEKISDCIERIKDYSEDSLPVLNEKEELIGIITSQDIIEAVDDEMGDDYAKLAGLAEEEDLKEPLKDSIRKRLPWLVALLFLGTLVSTVIGLFENVVATLPVLICFQSLICGMAGNVGTQSLAVTIRVLVDENLSARDKFFLVFKEGRVGLCNGLLLGVTAVVCMTLYIVVAKGYTFAAATPIGLCVGVALLIAMIISSIVGTVIPIFFNKIHVDPAVASGPFISTVNDLIAVVVYYGLSWVLLINILKL